MLNLNDIKKITEYQVEVFKDVFMTKEDGRQLEVKIDKIQNSLNAVVKDKQAKDGEMAVLN